MRSHHLLLLILASALGTSTAPGQCPDRSGGIGGTGYTATPEGGVGGTGLNEGEETKGGIGGTGFADKGDGIGGTGILGEIKAFGSICVNGYEIEYDDATPVEVDGTPASAADLAIGQVVTVEARGNGPDVVAERIRVDSNLVGPIETAADGSLRVNGREVRLLPATAVQGRAAFGEDARKELAPGQAVRVHGFPRPDGSVEATRVEVVDPRTRPFTREPRTPAFDASVGAFSIEGVVFERPGRGSVNVGGIRIEVSRETRLDGVAAGDRVRVNGRRGEDGVLRAERLENRRRDDDKSSSRDRERNAAAEEDGDNARDDDRRNNGSGRADTEYRDEIEDRADRTEDAVEDSIERIEDRLERIDRDADDARDALEDRLERIERVEREERAERIERIERDDRTERVERIERDDRTERAERVERDDRPERDERPDRGDRIDLDDLFDRD